MYLDKLRTFSFRNLEDAETFFPNSTVFLVGKNGNGKTNLLEAIYILSQGKSFRTTVTNELVTLKNENKESSVFGNIHINQETLELGIVFKNKEKEGYINQEKCKSRDDYIAKFKTVLFSPETLALVQGGPIERRKFIDKHSVDVDQRQLREIINFQKIFKIKNALLKRGNVSINELESINILFADASIKLRDLREKFIENLRPEANKTHQEFANYDGKLELSLKDSFDGMTRDEAFNKLMQNSSREKETAKCSLGAHKTELEIRLDGKDARSFASQGQARSIAVALILSVVKVIEDATGEPIVLLLDDIDSELDKERRESLFREVFSKKRQVFITGTEARIGKQEEIQPTLFEVISGQIRSI